MQQELAARLLVTKGNVTGVVSRMEALGWIKRRPDPDDRRIHRLYLSEDGRTVFAAVAPVRREAIGRAMAEFLVKAKALAPKYRTELLGPTWASWG